MLDRWPEPARSTLNATLATARPGDIAVFDADNTLWMDDITEGMLAWLAHTGALDVNALAPVLTPLPLRPGETLWSYYQHLCAFSIHVGYLWAVQVFAGFTVRELRDALHSMLDHGAPIPVAALGHGAQQPGHVPIPRPYARMRELISALHDVGVACWIVSASHEELVRLLASDPVRGLGIPPDRVCGVNLLLQGPDDMDWGARARQEGRSPWTEASWLDRRLTAHPVAPLTWYEGKVAAVRTWISPTARPILAAGDSTNDVPMQLLVDPRRGTRLRIRRQPGSDAATARAIAARHGSDAEAGWLAVTPAELGAGEPTVG